MTIENLVERYLQSTRQVFQQIKETKTPKDERVKKVLDYTKRYLEDAIYYRDQKRFETALATVAYCEGLLDALRLIGMVKFEWSTKRR
jgi:FAD synthetase